MDFSFPTPMSPPKRDSLTLGHLPVTPPHPAFSMEHVWLPSSASSWTLHQQSLAQGGGRYASVCVCGGGVTYLMQSPEQGGAGINAHLPSSFPPSSCWQP